MTPSDMPQLVKTVKTVIIHGQTAKTTVLTVWPLAYWFRACLDTVLAGLDTSKPGKTVQKVPLSHGVGDGFDGLVVFSGF